MGRYADALPLYQRALSISEKANGAEHPSTGTKLGNLASLYKAMGRYADALPLLQRALSISEKANGQDHPTTGIRLNNLASLYHTMGRYADALPLFQRYLSISEKANGEEHPDTGTALGNLASLYQTMGRYTDAFLPFQRSLSISEKANGAEHPSTGNALGSLASLYQTMGRYADALPLLQRALSISEKANGEEHPDTGTALGNLASLYQTMGRYTDALPLFQRYLSISEKANGGEHPDTGNALGALADLYRDMGRYAAALPLFQRAVSISERGNGPNHPLTGVSVNSLARLYQAMSQYADALPLFERALSISEKALGPGHPLTGMRLIRVAGLHQDMGEPVAAEPLLQRAWGIAMRADSPELSWTTQGGLRDAYSGSRPDLAIWHGKQAVNTLQATRTMNKSMDEATRRSFVTKNSKAYSALADLLFAQGRLIEGQRVLAMLKESEYFDFIERDGPSDPRTSRAEDTERERPWTARYQEISSQLVALSKEYEEIQRINESVRTPQEKERLAKLDADLVVGRQAFDAFSVELKKELGRQGGQAASNKRHEEIGAKELKNLGALQGTLESLGHGSVILHYLMTDQRLWILLTTPTIQILRQAAIGETDLKVLIGHYRAAIDSRDPKINEMGKALYDLLIGPVAADLEQAKAETLMLSLDGNLRYFPMAALYDGEKYLTQRYRLAMYTEAARANLKDPVKPQWRFAGFGLTEARANFSPLPSVRGELEGMVASGFPGDIRLNQDFTADSFKAGLARRPPVVHIASHFVFKPGTKSDSFLVLGDGSSLSLEAIEHGNFRFSDVDLVTLSACETAMGGGIDENGSEVEGFGALVQNQGAKGVIATLWSVADESTGEFMQLFYGYRQGNPGMTKAEAMQKAQEAFIEGRVALALTEVSRAAVKPPQTTSRVGTDHPYFWAPFTLMGNWR